MKEAVSFGDFMDVIISMVDGTWNACRIRPPDTLRANQREKREESAKVEAK